MLVFKPRSLFTAHCPLFSSAHCSLLTAHCSLVLRMPTEIIDPLACPGWNETISSNPEHSFFHSSNWAAVLKDSYSYKPLYFTRREGVEVSALIPVMEVKSFLTGTRGVSLPFTDICEPVASDEDGFSALLDEVLQYGRGAGWKYLELRGGAQRFNGAVPYRTWVRHVLALRGGESELFRRLNSATRRNIRTAQKSGVRVTISGIETDLDEYYRLHCLTRKRHGVPPQPRGFFKAIFRNVISKGKGFTALATYQGRPVSGAVYFHSGKKAIYKFGASDLGYQRLRPANLVMWEAIRHFSKNGFDELCLGRTEPENAGLIRFKEGWGTHESEISYYRLDPLSGKMSDRSGHKLPYGLMRKVPFFVSRIVGSLLYRHMG